MDETWGVYRCICAACGRDVIVVATVASMDEGYAEWLETPVCSLCAHNQQKGALN